MSWLPMNEGKMVGTRGSEEGVILLDEEYTEGARITLEQGGCAAPWSITCGIYGSFLHTAFASSESEARNKFSKMKVDVESIMAEQDKEARYEKMRHFANVY